MSGAADVAAFHMRAQQTGPGGKASGAHGARAWQVPGAPQQMCPSGPQVGQAGRHLAGQEAHDSERRHVQGNARARYELALIYFAPTAHHISRPAARLHYDCVRGKQ